MESTETNGLEMHANGALKMQQFWVLRAFSHFSMGARIFYSTNAHFSVLARIFFLCCAHFSVFARKK
jgi:hypothetical protein